MTGANRLTRSGGLGPPDAKAAAAALKLARVQLDSVTDIDRHDHTVAANHHNDIAASQHRSKIGKLINAMAKSPLLVAKRQVHVTTVALTTAVRGGDFPREIWSPARYAINGAGKDPRAVLTNTATTA